MSKIKTKILFGILTNMNSGGDLLGSFCMFETVIKDQSWNKEGESIFYKFKTTILNDYLLSEPYDLKIGILNKLKKTL